MGWLRVKTGGRAQSKSFVRSTLDTRSGRCRRTLRRRAMCGRLLVGKDFLHACSNGRSSHVFGLLVRHTWPLAIMPSADQVPVNPSHSMMPWPLWVVLITGSTGSALRAVCPFQPLHHVGCPTRSLHTISAAGCLLRQCTKRAGSSAIRRLKRQPITSSLLPLWTFLVPFEMSEEPH
jgi:hypothetical protein